MRPCLVGTRAHAPVFDREVRSRGAPVVGRSVAPALRMWGRAGSLAPHEASNLPGLRSGLRGGAPRMQVRRCGPWDGAFM